MWTFRPDTQPKGVRCVAWWNRTRGRTIRTHRRGQRRAVLGKALYVIVGAPGVWRKVANPGVTDATDRGIVVAHFGGAKLHLMWDAAINAELAQAGFSHPPAADCPDELFKVIDVTKKLAAEPPATLLTTVADGVAGTVASAPQPARRGRKPRATGTNYTMPMTEPDGSPREGSIIAPVAIDHMTTPPPQSVPLVAQTMTASATTPGQLEVPAPVTGFAQVNEMEI